MAPVARRTAIRREALVRTSTSLARPTAHSLGAEVARRRSGHVRGCCPAICAVRKTARRAVRRARPLTARRRHQPSPLPASEPPPQSPPEPKSTARFVVAHAEQGFTSNVPLAALEDDNALIAWEADGEPLTPDHGWPLRLVVPSRYFWKSAKWLRGLELRSTDEPGFWERYGYHNDADPWQEERYSF